MLEKHNKKASKSNYDIDFQTIRIILVVIPVLVVSAISSQQLLMSASNNNIGFALTGNGQQQQPNINASYVYHSANMILGNNVKNLRIISKM
jgi:hypothetical protein